MHINTRYKLRVRGKNRKKITEMAKKSKSNKFFVFTIQAHELQNKKIKGTDEGRQRPRKGSSKITSLDHDIDPSFDGTSDHTRTLLWWSYPLLVIFEEPFCSSFSPIVSAFDFLV